MRVAGIIAEYNPFHNGHLYHLEQTRKKTGADFVVAVMSGSFVQRGEPALADKWYRSRMAVLAGVDLVLELPFAFACNHSGLFARGGVELLEGLGVVTHLVFGAETPDLASLERIAAITAQEEAPYRNALQAAAEEGVPYAAARQRGVEAAGGKALGALMQTPNNILAIEYLRWLLLQKSSIEPVLLPRKGPGYHQQLPWRADDGERSMASATGIRAMLRSGEAIEEYVPETSLSILKEPGRLVSFSDLTPLVFYRILQQGISGKEGMELSEIYAAGEGLENRIRKLLGTSPDLEALVRRVKSRRYAEARIKRLLIQALVGLTRERMDRILAERQRYARVLAFNDQGQELLSWIRRRKAADLPVITNINRQGRDAKGSRDLLELDLLASEIYNLAAGADRYRRSDRVLGPGICRATEGMPARTGNFIGI